MSVAKLYGLVAEFDSSDALTAAAERLHQAGFRRIEAFSPFEIEPLAETIEQPRYSVPLTCFGAGLLGFGLAMFMQWWAEAFNYPLNVGGRPLASWPAFGPVAFEIAMIFGVGFSFIAFFIVNRFPRLSDPVFSAPGFERASRDGFFLCVEARDPLFNRPLVDDLLRQTGPRNVAELSAERAE